MAMELCACRPISDLPVSSPLLARNQHLRPKHALPLKMPVASRLARGIHFRYRHFSVSLPRAAASEESYGSSPYITEERDSAAVSEDSSPASSVAVEDSPPASSVAVEDSPPASSVAEENLPAENLSSDEIVTPEVPKEEPVEDAPVVAVEDSLSASSATVGDSSSAENVAYNETSTAEEPKEEPKEKPVEVAQEWTLDSLIDLKLESVDKYSLALYGGGASFGLWLVSAVVGAVDSIPLVPKLLEIVGLGYTLWFAARFLLFKESRDELAAKIDEIKEQVIG
ncbi:Protein CURVATURE THYLAKOID 1D, chloroplastic [Cucurbita argyrosperma subsp. argyrosperma]|uniref:Protein CURVATURE THYLAKOID 1A, chloroplastic-like isoform X1 n=1 Tax=Cucurbita moschata TaxID=3662 RepID=A0A6J1FXL3_CUCMO|nr:protein CURVATURE THYLAKOID 1A, chloroplastic-like isoform X1 [Cucurbita moschata]KAG7031301.1 Protein CURVATURE THYLAKOID 1D, chloroplastic [Cucurbita argyrosperma subsp. argyrosperma]